MRHIILENGKAYRVSYDGQVEVFVPAGEPRVMRDPKRAYWRSIKTGSRTFTAVHTALSKGE
jgi:hypothetical protein